MEGFKPKREAASNERESEASFEAQLSLAKSIFDAVNARNGFVRSHGGDFDTFAESWQHVGDMRAQYDRLEDAVTKARAEFDESVLDKKVFVEQARSAGNEDLADMVASMFGVKKSLLSRILRKG